MNMEDWKILVKSKMKKLGISQYALAEKLGYSQGAIAHWLSGNRQPDFEVINKLLEAVELPPLSVGNGTITTESLEPTYKYPVISWVSAGSCKEAWQPEYHDDFMKTDVNAGKNGFWLQVKGDSMTSPLGITFPETMYILVNPDTYVRGNDFIVAKLIDTNEATFKQYVEEAGIKYLKPLNSAYKMQELDARWQIIGKVVDARWRLG